ncbi:MAG TPA: ABC transporter permease [Candidatus Acidoferrales bacterium]|nr:ABC transporter permease [Candidatus Acidoferrales bacterium]
MTIWRKFASWLPWYRRRARDAELARELRDHLHLEQEDQQAAGLSPKDAASAAHRALGNSLKIEEDVRRAWGLQWLETLAQDVRYGLRMLRKSPGFTAVAVLTLALGIGANTAIFSVVNSVLLEPLPFAQSSQLVVIGETSPGTPGGFAGFPSYESYPTFLDWQRQARSFSNMGAYQYTDMALVGRGQPTVVHGALASSGIFATLGVMPLLGRTLEPSDDVKNAPRVVVIGEQLWRGQLGADPQIVGGTLLLDSEAFTVIGVMPGSFRFPDREPPVQFWVPIEQTTSYSKFIDYRSFYYFFTIGRLAPGVGAAQARSELGVIANHLVRQYNLGGPEVAHVENLRKLISGNVQSVLLILFGAVGFVALIACANVANLLLARATMRGKEIAVRLALGAARSRVFRQLLTESILLGVCAGAAGMAVAYGGIKGINTFASAQLPHIRAIRLDAWVLAFTSVISMAAGVLFGLAPAWQSSGLDLSQAFRECGQSSTSGLKRQWTRSVLVATEVALAFILLIGSGLLLNSLHRLTEVMPGFDSQSILKADVALPQSEYVTPEQRTTFFRQAVTRLKALPGVEDAAAGLPIPFTVTTLGYNFSVVGQPPLRPEQEPMALTHSVTPDYFRVMRIPLLRGREFRENDSAPGASNVVIIGEELARRLFSNEDPLGQQLKIRGFPAPYVSEIIGIVGDVKDKSLAEAPQYMLYVPYTQEAWRMMSLVLRTKGSPSSLASAVSAIIHALDSSLPLQDVRPLSSLIYDSEGSARFRSVLLGSFGALALLLATVGIYSTIAYVVAQRTHEIGIRMALGAEPARVMRLILTQGMKLAVIGLAIGVVASLEMTRLLSSLLFGISATDPFTFAGVAVLLLVVALAACYIPARRAMRVDPMVALRYE